MLGLREEWDMEGRGGGYVVYAWYLVGVQGMVEVQECYFMTCAVCIPTSFPV